MDSSFVIEGGKLVDVHPCYREWYRIFRNGFYQLEFIESVVAEKGEFQYAIAYEHHDPHLPVPISILLNHELLFKNPNYSIHVELFRVYRQEDGEHIQFFETALNMNKEIEIVRDQFVNMLKKTVGVITELERYIRYKHGVHNTDDYHYIVEQLPKDENKCLTIEILFTEKNFKLPLLTVSDDERNNTEFLVKEAVENYKNSMRERRYLKRMR